MSAGSEHIAKVDNALHLAEGHYGMTKEEVHLLATEVRRLRSVVTSLTPCMGYVIEEAITFVEELEESGVDPREPSLARLNAALMRLATRVCAMKEESHS